MFVTPPSAADNDYVVYLEAQGGPCPVCGHPTGDCVGDEPYHGQVVFVPEQKENPRATFRVPQRIYIEEEIGSKKVRRLLYAKGEAITPEEAKRLGLM